MALQDEQHSKRFKKFHSRETSSEDPPLVPSLPQEIIVDILTRLPVESLLRCKSVCKSWCLLISDPHFIKSHLSLSASNNHYAHHRLIFTTASRISVHTCPLYDVLHDKYVNALDHGHPLDKYYYTPSLLIAGSCNGLVCIVMDKYDMLIGNPGTRRWISLPCGFDNRYYPNGSFGFGYDESTDDYKVVMIYHSCRSRAKNVNKVKIYSFRTAIWKQTGDFPHECLLNGAGKFSNGALHWASCGPSYPWTIVSIDLADETYGEVLQPMYDEGNKDLTLGVLGECLCVLCTYGENHSDVWVMKVYGVKDSWTKLVSIPYLAVPRRDQLSVPLFISNDGKVLRRLGLKLIVYDSKNNTFSEIQNFDNCFKANTFVESLISPPVRWNLRKRRIP